MNETPARVSATGSVTEATIVMTSFARIAESKPAAFERLLRNHGMLRAWGDCYGYLMVAAGRADAMLDPEMNIWDAAALYPIVTEAGGRMTTWEGEDRVGDSVVASNGRIHDESLAMLQP